MSLSDAYEFVLMTCKQAVNQLLPTFDALAFSDVKPDERATFMSPRLMVIMHLLEDLEEKFPKNYLRPLDGVTGLIIVCYQVLLIQYTY